ncbi:erythromycin esterase-domain-containing protein [Thelonectria olida]|uniref:Erythromycin esterase-domain-containing protein n=1 Tax=Thelonectria olida TaxID=1576542 RepID=A0A9P8VXX9_9HYPO|nr:erythromycin esterase-domain-containing protein [Thelonectria olida]
MSSSTVELLRANVIPFSSFSEDFDAIKPYLDSFSDCRVLLLDAERYYRAMYSGQAESWNLRDTHMFQTLVRILKHHGDDSKAIVWAHNSHVGNARATSMGWSRGELNIGQLCKEAYGPYGESIYRCR